MSQTVFKAIGQTTKGDPSVLKVIELPLTKPTGRDLLVRVKAVSANPTDTKFRSGDYVLSEEGPLKEPLVVGFDAAGVVEAVGDNVSGFKIGDEVWYAGDRTRRGSNAEFAIVDERIVGKKPKSLRYEDAAALPLTTVTAWESLVEHLRIPIPQDGQTNPKSLLIINGAGGAGSAAIQISRNILKLTSVIATASRPETIEWCKSQGATHIINHREPLKPQLDKQGLKVDYILVAYRADLFMDQVVELINPLGKINLIVPFSKPFNTTLAFMKSLDFSFELMYTKAHYNINPESQGEILNTIKKYVEDGLIKPTVTQRYDFTVTNMRKVHEQIESGKSFGKIVLGLEGINFAE